MLDSDVLIIGGGPAGSAAAIALAKRGFKVILLEKRKIPRNKLCGEFVAPAAVQELDRLGALDAVRAAGARAIARARIYSMFGACLDLPFEQTGEGLGISRAKLDTLLLERAGELGVEIIDGFRVEELRGDGSVAARGTCCRTGRGAAFTARSAIDASGLHSRHKRTNSSRRLFAFKAHIEAAGPSGTVELFSYRGGYGGLIEIESGARNLCFIIAEDLIRQAPRDPLALLLMVLGPQHPVAGRLAGARLLGRWLSGGPLEFGPIERARFGPAAGDAAGLIDPFTGQGIWMALQSGRLLGENLSAEAKENCKRRVTAALAGRYARAALIRPLAFKPRLCHLALLGASGNRRLGLALLKMFHRA